VIIRYRGWRGETEPLYRVLLVPLKRLLLLLYRFGFIIFIILYIVYVGCISLSLFLLHPNVLLVLFSVVYLAITAESMLGYLF
jgi:hypothetical protein